jgi:putative membrane protein
MHGSLSELFTRWDVPPVVSLLLLLAWIVYLRGWVRLRCTRPEAVPGWRCGCFSAGMLALFTAVASPLDTFSESLLFMHMAQHFVLMSVVPPLIVLGSPTVPLLRGLPSWIIRRPLSPFFRNQIFLRAGHFLADPRFAWVGMNAAYIGWHIPRAYEFALSSENWHNVEHMCFLFTSILFWWPIVLPWPTRRTGSRWSMIPYLLFSDVVNTAISAFLCFSGRILYPSYAAMERPFGINALSDQIAAGAFMWVFGSIVFLIPAAILMMRLLANRVRAPLHSPTPNAS